MMKLRAFFAAALLLTASLGVVTPTQAAGDAATYCKSLAGNHDISNKNCQVYYTRGADASGSDALKNALGSCDSLSSQSSIVSECKSIVNDGNQGAAAAVGGVKGAAGAPKPAKKGCGGASGACLDISGAVPTLSVADAVKDGIDIVSFLAGVLSVVFIILGGIRYTTSEGNPQNLTQAKQTITYAVSGLIISVLAPLIISFVIFRGPQ